MNRVLISACFLFLSVSNLFSSDNYFYIITGEKGLSHNNVKAITQDSDGFMWFGTRNKLNRYDGVLLKNFDCYDRNTQKGNNNISCISEIDKKLWIGTDKGVFLFDPITERFESFDFQTEHGTEITEWIADIQQDLRKNIWIIVPNQGVFRYETETKKCRLYTVVKELKPSISNPQCISIEKNGRVWIGSNGSGLFLYNNTTDTFTQYLGDKDGRLSLAGKNIYRICHRQDNIIIGVHEENLLKLDKRRNTLQEMNTPQINNTIIREIKIINDDIWVGTQGGLFIINENLKTVTRLKEDPLNKHSLSNNTVESIFQDKEGGIWVGTNFGGISYLPDRSNIFEKYFPISEKGSISSKRVREIQEDQNGLIWVGTEDAGVSVFNPKTKTFKEVKGLRDNKTLAFLIRKNKSWVGFFKNGLDIINHTTNDVRHYSASDMGLNEESIFALCEDSNEQIWLGNAWGVYLADKTGMRFNYLDIFGLCYTYDIMEDTEGYIWVATMGSGVFQYEPKSGVLVHHTTGGKDKLSSNSVSSITEDHLGQIWFATDRGGICVYNKQHKKFKSYSIEDGLPDDITYKILEDKDYNLWFGTNKGLVKFSPQTKQIRIFTQNEGLLSNQFNYKSGLISHSGKLYFGSMEGLIAFQPEELKANDFIPPVFITKLSIFNKEITPNTENSPLEKSIIHTDKIELPYNLSNITLEFVALSYTAAQANTYAYKLEGIDSDWIYTQNNQSASYAKLPPGKYIFKVKGSNNDGLWNNVGARLEIRILPPWWNSNAAYLMYFIWLLSSLYFCIRYSIKKYKKRTSEKQLLFRVEKERELYEAKVNFFTEIAHEIRTPVTLINGPLESILEMDIQEPDIKHNLSIIEQNTKNLLLLINQLLDFRKVDSHKFLLNFKNTDITGLFTNCIENFKKQTIASKLTFNIRIPVQEHILAIADREALHKIFNNLLSNAVKYAEKIIDISLNKDEEYFTLQISNDGSVIPEELKEKIFEPFFQVKSAKLQTSGSGIGLSLSRSLSELHNGFLYYTPQAGLNTFILKIPLYQDNDMTENQEPIVPEENTNIDENYILEYEEAPTKKKEAQTILIVEDNPEMLHFISEKLNKTYRIECARNGIEGQQILQQKSIDLVISDIMMPEMTGFELCEYIKSNIEYSHILVILLTAKNDLQSKIKGLEIGADAYVEKPFSFQYLQTLIISLTNNRKREFELFVQKPFLPSIKSTLNKVDEQFLNNVVNVINENLTDSNFNVETLADAVHMSRSSLHRKMRGTIDTTPVDFIRLVRLQKAAQLLIEGKHRINEICYLVGINTPSYLIKLFQHQYGMTPKEFAKMHQGKETNEK